MTGSGRSGPGMAEVSERADAEFRVVFVCTGNQARSPLGEALFRRYTTGYSTSVTSFGTLDIGPAPVLPAAVAAAERLGVDLTEHRARALRHARLETADLVLGFETSHVADAVLEAKAPPERTFLLGELALLLAEPALERGSHEHARSALATADLRRVRTRPDPSAPIVPDPVGRSTKYVARVADEVDRLVRQVVVGLFGPIEEVVAGERSRRRRWRA